MFTGPVWGQIRFDFLRLAIRRKYAWILLALFVAYLLSGLAAIRQDAASRSRHLALQSQEWRNRFVISGRDYLDLCFNCLTPFTQGAWIYHAKAEESLSAITNYPGHGLLFSRAPGDDVGIPGRRIDLFFMVAICGSFLAMVFSQDAVSREKEEGTLSLLFAHPMGRVAWFSARTLSRFLLSFLPLAAACLFLAFLDPSSLAAISLFCIAAGLFLAVFTALNLCISTLSSTSTSSILQGLVGWVFLVLLFPSVSAGLARSAGIETPGRFGTEAFFQTDSQWSRQEEAWSRIDAPSPFGHFERAARILSGKETASLQSFARLAADAERRFQEWKENSERRMVKDYPRAFDPSVPYDVQAELKAQISPDFRDMPPPLSMAQRSFSTLFGLVLPHLLILAGLSGMLLLAGLLCFLKMDLRRA